MAVPKSNETRVAGIFTDKVHPYSFSIETLLHEKIV